MFTWKRKIFIRHAGILVGAFLIWYLSVHSLLLRMMILHTGIDVSSVITISIVLYTHDHPFIAFLVTIESFLIHYSLSVF